MRLSRSVRQRRLLVSILAAGLVVAALTGCTSRPGGSGGSRSGSGGGFGGGNGPGPGATAPAATATSTPGNVPSSGPAKAAWEALMGPAGEYAAYAAYDAVITKYGEVEPYLTIRSEEQMHANALIRQLSRMGVEAPVNPYVGKISAPDSLEQAASNWADGEVNNIALYDQLMSEASPDATLVKVFTNLRRASQDRHLPMFRAAAQNGGTLTAEQMSQYAMPGH